jgi:hypothetical protein
MTMTIVAIIAVSLAVGTWLGIRLSEANRQINDVLETVLNTPLKPSACAACDPGAADTGARAGAPPLPGAGSTLKPPAPATSTGQSAQWAPGHHK